MTGLRCALFMLINFILTVLCITRLFRDELQSKWDWILVTYLTLSMALGSFGVSYLTVLLIWGV